MGGRGDGPRREIDREEGVKVSIARQGDGPRPFKVMDYERRNNVLCDARGRPRMFASEDAAERAARRDGVAWGRENRHSVGRVFRFDE